MEALGIISQLYMWVLVILLFLGLGLGILGFINFVSDKLEPKGIRPISKTVKKATEPKSITPNQPVSVRTGSIDGNWLRFAAFSFLGLLSVVTILGFFSMSNKPPSATRHTAHAAIGNVPDAYGTMNGFPGTNSMPSYDPAKYGMSGSQDAYVNYPNMNMNGHMIGTYGINGTMPYGNTIPDFSGSYNSPVYRSNR